MPDGSRRLSPPGLLFAGLGLAALALPFETLRENRIVLGEGLAIWNLGTPTASALTVALMVTGLALGAQAAQPWLRLTGSLLGLAAIVLLLSRATAALLADAGDLARGAPAAGFWCLLLVFMMLMADALSELRPGPGMRLGLLVLFLAAFAGLLLSGALSELSIMQEYRGRADGFRTAAARHCALAFGSLAAAGAIGFPLGILCHRRARLRSMAIPVLSFLQTIPSLAMFGLMIPVLAWVAATVPGARAAGIAGIGFAPAFLALLIYSLLPVVANTVAGLQAAPPSAVEAARGMGMTARQQMFGVELPLALPVMLAGLRIVLVQNVGLAVIAGLIGGGGFGTFVFQGLNQTATDLILLGAIPTVILALVSAILMDILVEAARRRPERRAT